jgi:hypothetical protein
MAYSRRPAMVNGMTLILRLPCNSCAKRHDFCFPDEKAVQPGAQYGYICSDTKRAASFMAPDLNERSEILPTCPRGSIEVRRIQVGS